MPLSAQGGYGMNLRFMKTLWHNGRSGIIAHSFDIPVDKIVLVSQDGARMVNKSNVLLKSFMSLPQRKGK
jgi:hypothetical protein